MIKNMAQRNFFTLYTSINFGLPGGESVNASCMIPPEPKVKSTQVNYTKKNISLKGYFDSMEKYLGLKIVR
jgi:hypothetical protein